MIGKRRKKWAEIFIDIDEESMFFHIPEEIVKDMRFDRTWDGNIAHVDEWGDYTITPITE